MGGVRGWASARRRRTDLGLRIGSAREGSVPTFESAAATGYVVSRSTSGTPAWGRPYSETSVTWRLHFATRTIGRSAVCGRWRGQRHWLLDPRSPVHTPLTRHGVDVNARTRRNVIDAVRRAGGEAAPPGKVIAELSFGFWRYLSSRAHEKTLWVPYLYRAYPTGTDRRQVDRAVMELAELRNRIAHLEPIFKRDLRRAHRAMLQLSELLRPGLADYLRATTTVAAWLDARP